MSGATQLPLYAGEPGSVRVGDLRSGMSFRDPATGATWLVLKVEGSSALGAMERVEVTYLVTTVAGETSTVRHAGWTRGLAWRDSERMYSGVEP